ncbi:MAG: RING finger protein [Oscillospiraceae bacterium]
MFNFKGCNCSVCGKPLSETDDIVVCPECGAPYHRACYAETGVCVHEDKHAHGFEYARPNAAKQSVLVCSGCNTKNSSDNIFCENCGQPLHAGKEPMQQNIVPDSPPGYLGMPVINPNEEIDGVPAGDWNQYIGSSAPYYLYQFKHMDMLKRKTSICWSAVLFGPLYFFYRKMWAWGTATALAMIALNVPSFLYLMQKAGVTFTLGISAEFLVGASYFASILASVLSIGCGIFAIYLYRKQAGKKLRALRARITNSEAYHTALTRKSGPSVLGVVLSLVVLTLMSYALVNIIGYETISAMMLL